MTLTAGTIHSNAEESKFVNEFCSMGGPMQLEISGAELVGCNLDAFAPLYL